MTHDIDQLVRTVLNTAPPSDPQIAALFDCLGVGPDARAEAARRALAAIANDPLESEDRRAHARAGLDQLADM